MREVDVIGVRVEMPSNNPIVLLREVSGERLGVALRGADPKVREKITRNMSQRAAEILLEDMEARGPVRLSDVETAQKVLRLIDALEDLDDVQNVYHNAEISDEIMQQLG